MAKITGRQRLRAIIRLLPAELRAEIKKATLSAAEACAAAQRSMAPFHTGALRNSITVTPGDRPLPAHAFKPSRGAIKDPGLAAIVSVGNTNVRYAHLVEFGTSPHTNKGEFPGTQNPGAPAEPFFIPGYRATRRKGQAQINKAARNAIKKVFSAVTTTE